MSLEHQQDETVDPLQDHFSIEGDQTGLPAWTEVAEGRFMPRRVRGSFPGRALG
ncbi:MAG: hypothetical protein JSS02_00150 [Planctomycetes bacterium]|nr:hypothetical protein [Planctomycetota bacterium]